MDSFDRRVVSDEVLGVLRALQGRAPGTLIGGAALSGIHLRHRLSRDVDLAFPDPQSIRALVRELPGIAAQCGASVVITRDAGSFVRATAKVAGQEFAIDLVHEAAPNIEPSPPPVEGIVVQSLADLRASKIACLLERTEPRDLVDLLFLERAGFDVIGDLPLALQKDAGIDPGTLAWLLESFPVAPLPQMLEPLTTDELQGYRRDLAARLRSAALPGD